VGSVQTVYQGVNVSIVYVTFEDADTSMSVPHGLSRNPPPGEGLWFSWTETNYDAAKVPAFTCFRYGGQSATEILIRKGTTGAGTGRTLRVVFELPTTGPRFG